MRAGSRQRSLFSVPRANFRSNCHGRGDLCLPRYMGPGSVHEYHIAAIDEYIDAAEIRSHLTIASDSRQPFQSIYGLG